jgi:hypothetical protein
MPRITPVHWRTLEKVFLAATHGAFSFFSPGGRAGVARGFKPLEGGYAFSFFPPGEPENLLILARFPRSGGSVLMKLGPPGVFTTLDSDPQGIPCSRAHSFCIA